MLFYVKFDEIRLLACDVRESYRKFELEKYGKEWDNKDIGLGFVGDVGDLMKLITAKEGKRSIDDLDARLAHELSDCLWSVLVLADRYGVDLESEFVKTMGELKLRIE